MPTLPLSNLCLEARVTCVSAPRRHSVNGDRAQTTNASVSRVARAVLGRARC